MASDATDIIDEIHPAEINIAAYIVIEGSFLRISMNAITVPPRDAQVSAQLKITLFLQLRYSLASKSNFLFLERRSVPNLKAAATSATGNPKNAMMRFGASHGKYDMASRAYP